MNIQCITTSDYYKDERYDITLIHESLLRGDTKAWNIPGYMPLSPLPQAARMHMEQQYGKRFSALGMNTRYMAIISSDNDDIGIEISRNHPRRVAFWVPETYAENIIMWFRLKNNHPASTYLQSVLLARPDEFLISFVIPDHADHDVGIANKMCDHIIKHSLWNAYHRIDISSDHDEYSYVRYDFKDGDPYPTYDDMENTLEMVIASHDKPGYYDFVFVMLTSGIETLPFSTDWWNEVWRRIKEASSQNDISDIASNVNIVRKSVIDVKYPISTSDMISWIKWNDIKNYDSITSARCRMHEQIQRAAYPPITHLWYREAYRMWCQDIIETTPLCILRNSFLHKKLISFLEARLPKHDNALRDKCCFLSENDHM